MSWIGARLERFEDERLLTGRGRYVADLGLPHMLHACFVRSPHPHAVIRRIDTEQARRAATIFTAADLPHSPLLDSVQMDGLAKTPQPALAAGRNVFGVGHGYSKGGAIRGAQPIPGRFEPAGQGDVTDGATLPHSKPYSSSPSSSPSSRAASAGWNFSRSSASSLAATVGLSRR